MSDTQTTEQRVAKLCDRLEPVLDKIGGFEKFNDRIKAVEALLDVEGEPLNHRVVREEFEALKAAQEKIKNHLRNKRDAFYVSGLEDQHFDLPRFSLGWVNGHGAKAGFEAAGAMNEYEIATQCIEAARKRHGDAALKASGITSGSSETAANFIPDQVLAEVIPAIYAQSAFINLTGDGGKGSTRIRVMDGLFGGEVRLNGFQGGFVPFWIGADDDIPESKFKTKQLTMRPKKLGMLTSINEDLELLGGGAGLDGLMRDDMSQRASDELDNVIPFGTGGNQPLGICKTPGVQFYSAQAKVFGTLGTTVLSTLNSGDWTGGVLNFDGLDELDLSMAEDKIRPANRTTWSGDRFFSALKRLKVENYSAQSSGNPYLLGMPMLTNARLAELIGPFAASTHDFFVPSLPGASIGAPAATAVAAGAAGLTCETVIRGNGSELILGRWAGVQITDDGGKGVGFASGAKYVRFVFRCDLLVREPRALRICPDAKVK